MLECDMLMPMFMPLTGRHRFIMGMLVVFVMNMFVFMFQLVMQMLVCVLFG